MKKRLWVVLILLAASGLAVADEADQPDEEPYPEVSGSIGFGFTAATGNTESAATRLRATTTLDYERWRHRFSVSAFHNEEDGTSTADRRSGSAQSDLRISEHAYLFANVNGERDRFGSFERRYSGSLGIGRRFVDTTAMELDLEVGGGRRYKRAQGGDDTDSEGIGRFHGIYAWRITPHTTFIQDVEVEAGSDNTYTESETEVRSRLTTNLSWTLSYVIKRNSQVPEGTERTDTFTAVTLDYAF